MIEVLGLVKEHRGVRAVDELTFVAKPGRVTAFLGPNGAGKSSTMRILLGLDSATSGGARVEGVMYRALERPLTVVGAMLDGPGANGGRTAKSHLTWVARSNGIPVAEVDAVLERVGLANVGRKRIRAFSLGMGQRLGIASALLGNPRVLVLDEPTNGLDPEGIRWIRALLRALAAEGRTVLVSSHLITEMEGIADDVVVIAKGRKVADGTAEEVTGAHSSLEEAFFSLTQQGASGYGVEGGRS